MLTRIVCLICLLFSSSLLAQQTRSVLFISSYHPGFPTFFDQLAGLRDVLQEEDLRLDIEFLDSKRFASYEDRFQRGLEYKLSALPSYDLIITADDAATWFATQHRDSLFTDTPIVFFGVNDTKFGLSFNQVPQVTGILEATANRETIETIHALFGNDSPLYIITDATPTGQLDFQRFEFELQNMGIEDYQVLSLTNLSHQQLLREASSLRSAGAIVMISCYRDYNGESREFSATLSELRKRTQLPIFHLWRHSIGEGILGGKVVSHLHQARSAATMALAILNGADPSGFAVDPQPPTHFLFDYNIMQEFGLDPADMPAGSEFINLPPDQNSLLPRVLLAAGAFITVLGLTVIGLLVRIKIKHRQELRIRRSNQELQYKVSERTQELEHSNRETENLLRLRNSILDNTVASIVLVKGDAIQWVNRHAETLFGYSENELIGKPVSNLYHQHQDYRRVTIESPKILARGDAYQGEYAFRRKDGSSGWGMFSGKALNPDNLEEGVLFMLVDFTSRKDMENQLLEANKALEQLVITDHLTRIHNRRFASEQIQAEITRCQRYGMLFAVILIDIDHFKHINDQFGHDTGDAALIQVAQLVKQQCREVDTVARWGGEEFLVVCPETNLQQAEQLAELLRQRMMELSRGLPCQITASFGVAAYQENATIESLLKAADAALYDAKHSRNCVKVANATH